MMKASRRIFSRSLTAISISRAEIFIPPSTLFEEVQKEKEKIRIVDGTWFLPHSPFAGPKGSSPFEEYRKARLPKAVFLDLDKISDPTAAPGVGHNLPTNDVFASEMETLGIDSTMKVVAYDQFGLFTAPRVWFTFKVFGFEDVRILQGGLPGWKLAGYPIETESDPISDFAGCTAKETWVKRGSMQVRMNEMLANLQQVDSKKKLVIDARSAGRFRGDEPETRPGMRGGHIPGSMNLPFMELVDSAGPTMKEKTVEELKQVFQKHGISIDSEQVARISEDSELLETYDGIIATCGSGITAAHIALAAFRLGQESIAIYDGSWSEWGAKKDTPIMKSTPQGDTPV